MKKNIILILFILLIVLLGVYFIGPTNKVEAALMESTPELIVLTTEKAIITPTPYLTPIAIVTPSPTPTFELLDYDYPEDEARDISCEIWSGTPSMPTYKTKMAYAEIPQNMVDDFKKREQNNEKIQYYKSTIRYTLLMKTEFPSFNPRCYKNIDEFDKRRLENNEIADYVMRSWWYANITGDRSYRLTPQSGVRYSFYNVDGWDYIKVYDLDWNLVYDSGEN